MTTLILNPVHLIFIIHLERIICFACTFRDINTIDGILTWTKGEQWTLELINNNLLVFIK